MEKTFSSEPLERFTYHPQNDGTAIVYLRDNIEQDAADSPDGGESTPFWSADEVMTRTTLGFEDIADNFDQLWVKAETEGKSVEERLAEVEEITEALVAMALGDEE